MERLVEPVQLSAVIRRPQPRTPAFGTVVLDVDSGIAGIDGIEWLASRRGAPVARQVAAIAARARVGAIPPVQAYGERLAAIRPHRDEMDALSRAYVDAITPAGAETIGLLRRAGVRVLIVSHGPINAMYRLAYRLGFEMDDVHAVHIKFDALGTYAGFDADSRLARVSDRNAAIEALNIDGSILVVGSGPTERYIESFEQLASIALP